MLKRLVALGLVLSVASVAQAGESFSINLIPDVDPTMVSGGESVNVDMVLNHSGGIEEVVRLIRVDFSASDPSIGLDSWEFAYNGQPFCDDFNNCGAGWNEFGSLPELTAAFPGQSPDNFTSIFLPGDGSIVIGTLAITLPAVIPAEGVVLDGLNQPNADPANDGTQISMNFATPRDIREFGGNTSVTFVPEPATLALLGLGGLAALRRRKA